MEVLQETVPSDEPKPVRKLKGLPPCGPSAASIAFHNDDVNGPGKMPVSMWGFGPPPEYKWPVKVTKYIPIESDPAFDEEGCCTSWGYKTDPNAKLPDGWE